jgi:Tfp pilus assembly protein PilF
MEIIAATVAVALAGLTGVIRTPSGLPEPGVTVEVSPIGSSPITVVTDAEGRFTLTGLPEGVHPVRLRKGGNVMSLPEVSLDEGVEVLIFWNPSPTADERSAIVASAFQGGSELLSQARYDDAAQEFLRGLWADTAQASLWASLGLAHVGAGRLEDALFATRMAITLSPREGAYPNNAGSILFRLGRYSEAISYYERAAQVNPAGRGLYRSNIAACQYALGHVDEAIRSYQEASADPSMPPSGFYYLGSLLAARGERDRAMASLEQYLRVQPNGQFASNARQLLAKLSG